MPALRQFLRQVDDYPALLESCWQEHLAPRADNAPTVISTFAGCGGSSLGYSMAGFRELLAVEWDDNAVATFRLNFPDVPVYHGDIAKLSVDEVLTLTGLRPGQLDVFDGSPPCQGFSTAGKRIMDDPRNQLFREYVRLLRGLQPKVFVMENVSGMVKGKMKLIFVDILKELKASGYQVSARLLNAMYFGVPQSRERMIFIGVRNDLGMKPSHPQGWSKKIGAGVSIADLCMERPELAMNMPQDWPKRGGFCVAVEYSNPAPTLKKVQRPRSSAGLKHYKYKQGLDICELSRIGSFPDSFLFRGAWTVQAARIGNSVPPLFMRSIAQNIRREILDNLG